MCFVPKRCNDMMNVGRLQGFEVRIVVFLFKIFRWSQWTDSFFSRARSRPRGSCSSRIPSLSASRKTASCPEPERGGFSCSSSWSFSASPSTRRKVSPCQGTPSKTASRWGRCRAHHAPIALCCHVVAASVPPPLRSAVWEWRSTWRNILAVWCWPLEGRTAAWPASSCRRRPQK